MERESVKQEALQMNGRQLTTALDDLRQAVMPMIFDGFPEMPAGKAKQAVRLMMQDGLSVESAVSLIERAMRDFEPQYGVMYPSIAYLLGKRNGKNIGDDEDDLAKQMEGWSVAMPDGSDFVVGRDK